MRWFFDTYLRQAALPELVAVERSGKLMLNWKTSTAFAMPVEVQIDDRIVRVEMTGGTGEVPVPEGAHVVVDPFARVLKRSPAVEALQAWQRQVSR